METAAVPTKKRLIWTVMSLLLLGQIALFSASGVLGVQRHGSEFYYLTRQAISAVFGFGLMLFLGRVRYQVWYKLAFVAIWGAVLLVGLTYLPGIGHWAQGAQRWIRIGGFLFQPSELAKVAVPIFIARVLADYQDGLADLGRSLFRAGCLILLLAGILKQPDLGTTTLLVLSIIATLFIAGMRVVYLGTAFGVGAVGFIIAMLQSDYRRKRFFSFLNPWADPQGSGFQSIQSFLSFHSGGVWGSGIGNGNSKLFYLPEVHTDFIFSLVGEEMGFVGAFFLLLLFVYFSYLLFKIAFRAPDAFGTFLAFGIAFLLVAQTTINLGGVTGLLPVKGLPLPFLSWGRSALIVNLAMVGILLNIAGQSGIIDESRASLRCQSEK